MQCLILFACFRSWCFLLCFLSDVLLRITSPQLFGVSLDGADFPICGSCKRSNCKFIVEITTGALAVRDKTNSEIFSEQVGNIVYRFGKTIDEFRLINDSRKDVCRLYDQMLAACNVMKEIEDPFITEAVNRQIAKKIAFIEKTVERIKQEDKRNAADTSYLVFKKGYLATEGKLAKTTCHEKVAIQYAEEQKKKDPSAIVFVVRKRKDGSMRCIYRLE